MGLCGALRVELAAAAASAARRRSPEDLHLLLRGAKASEKASCKSSLLLVADNCGGCGEVSVSVTAIPETRPVQAFLGTSTGGVQGTASTQKFQVSPAGAQRLLAQLRQSAGAAELAAEPLPTPGPLFRWVGVVSWDSQQEKVKLRLASQYPSWAFYATSLARPLRTLATPLLEALLAPDPGTSMGFGFLTLDQGRCLLCLLEDEALAQEVPLVGVWVDLRHERDEDPEQSPALSAAAWAAAAHFVHRRQVREKVWVDRGTFLVMSVVQHRTPSSSSTQLLFSEFRFEDAPDEGLYLASLDFDAGQAGPKDLGQSLDLTCMDTFTADRGELAKIAGGAAVSPEILPSRAPEPPERTPSPSPRQSEEATPQETHMREELRTSVASSQALGYGRPEEPRSQPQPAVEDCRVCGASFLAEAAFCGHCGTRRPAPSPPDVPPQTHLWTPGASSPRKGRLSTPAARGPSTPSSLRSDASQAESISLRQIVGQQQQQLGLLQSQLQSVQQLLTHLVTKGSAQSAPGDAAKADAAVHVAPVDEVQVCVADTQTSPRSMVSTALQASVSTQEAAVNTIAAAKPEPRAKTPERLVQSLPPVAMRDSADTAGGASPRCLVDAQPPTIRGQLEPSWNPEMVGVPRILCPSELSFGSDDVDGELELSDDGSINWMGDFPLEADRLNPA